MIRPFEFLQDLGGICSLCSHCQFKPGWDEQGVWLIVTYKDVTADVDSRGQTLWLHGVSSRGQGYCAPWKGVGLQWVQLPPGNWVAPAGSYRSGGGGDETVEAFEKDVSL